jgi:hypothetical protein
LADPSEKIVKEPGPGAPDRVMLLADLPCKHPRRGTVVLPPKQRSLEIFYSELGALSFFKFRERYRASGVLLSDCAVELNLTKPEFYRSRAADCLLAAEQIPTDRDLMLHMATTYTRIAIECELHHSHGPQAPQGSTERQATT